MKILHLLGHKHNWALDSHFENKVGDGFIISAISIGKEMVGKKISGYSPEDYLEKSFIDLQYYGSKNSLGGKLSTYEFHPINYKGDEATSISTMESIVAGVKYQHRIGFKNILIPNIWCPDDRQNLDIIRTANKEILKIKDDGKKYYMTVPIGGQNIRDDAYIEVLLQELTDMDIKFDGYYIVCESNIETAKKISTDYKYYVNLIKVLNTLKKQGFETILGFSNIDSLVFLGVVDIDYISIGTYENLRKFTVKRFINKDRGGPSDGWYYSEKLLNFIKAKQLELLKERGVLNDIRNENNIFSDIILSDGYTWNTHKPEVHKNYLLAISRQLQTLALIPPGKDRIDFLTKMITDAKSKYQKLEEEKVFLDAESENYHLANWLSVINAPRN